MKLILETIVEGIATRVDGTLKITLSTQELEPTNAASLISMRGKFIKALLSDSNISKLEEELVDNTQLVSGKKNKSASQRLRAVLYRINEQAGGDETNFEAFYKSEMEKIIDHYKGKLE